MDFIKRRKISCHEGVRTLSFLGNIGEKLQSDFYILPCSKDECVIEAVSEGSELAELKEEVREVIKKYLNEPFVLTDHIYRYNRADGSLKIVG